MTLAAPNAIAMKLKFPEFAELDNFVLEFALEEAALFLTAWTHSARTIAQMYLAAHFISISNVSADTDGRAIISETIGRLSTTYAQGQREIGFGDLQSTSYGKRYFQLKNLGSKPFEVISTCNGSRVL